MMFVPYDLLPHVVQAQIDFEIETEKRKAKEAWERSQLGGLTLEEANAEAARRAVKRGTFVHVLQCKSTET